MNKINNQNNEAINTEGNNRQVLTNQGLHTEIIGNELLGNELSDNQAKYIASMLDAQSNQLSMRTLKRLENARECAVKAHSQFAGQTVNADHTLSQTIGWAEHHRLATAGMVLVAITAGFLLMQSMNQPEYSDAFLLGSDLPPEAFVDKGFAPSLNIKQAKI